MHSLRASVDSVEEIGTTSCTRHVSNLPTTVVSLAAQTMEKFENKLLRKIFGAKRDEVTGEWRKLHNAELHALYSSPDMIRNIKYRRLRWAGQTRVELSRLRRCGYKLRSRRNDRVFQLISQPVSEKARASKPVLCTGVRLECASATVVSIRRPEFECSGLQLEGPEFECRGPQLEGPEFEYSGLSLKVCGSRYCEL
ncbi:hypothetical protein ANN_01298 [Periplaneta americana]|uniref:Uncharacterized protein n=1 Tax=Periplaneta americana TaxID=6978 RepID=A0ABQ8TT69_PERAM|nr:hypothetical protein ANN_01298 [Periplaneta americana]